MPRDAFVRSVQRALNDQGPDVITTPGDAKPTTTVQLDGWLTRSTVSDFAILDFADLSPEDRNALEAAVATFASVAAMVPATSPATERQVGDGTAALRRLAAVMMRCQLI